MTSVPVHKTIEVTQGQISLGMARVMAKLKDDNLPDEEKLAWVLLLMGKVAEIIADGSPYEANLYSGLRLILHFTGHKDWLGPHGKMEQVNEEFLVMCGVQPVSPEVKQ